MNTFTESNTVEQMILDAVTRVARTVPPLVRKKSPWLRGTQGRRS